MSVQLLSLAKGEMEIGATSLFDKKKVNQMLLTISPIRCLRSFVRREFNFHLNKSFFYELWTTTDRFSFHIYVLWMVQNNQQQFTIIL